MRIFAYYAVAPAFFPRQAMARLLGERRPLREAAGAVGLVGALYALTSVVLAMAGAVPLVSSVLPLSPENYYFWQTFFAVPFAFLGWGAAAGMLHLLDRRQRGRVALKKTAALAGPAVAAALFVAWLPMALAAFLMVLGMNQEELVGLLSEPGAWQVFDFALYVLGAAAGAVLLTLAAAHGRFKKARRARTILIGGVATAVLAGVFAVFIR